MATECCGKSRETPFCPQCGGRLGLMGELEGLMKQCQANAKKLRESNKRYLHKARIDPGNDVRHLADARRAEEEALRWETWVVALMEVMASQE